MVYVKRKTKHTLHLSHPKIRTKVRIPLASGDCHFYSFDGLCDHKEHVALSFKEINSEDKPLVRIHSECLTGDVFKSERCDCGDQLWESIHHFSEQGGILIYLRQEGRGIGLYNKLDAYLLQEKGCDTFEANNQLNFPDDLRNYKVAAQMLKTMKVKSIRLLSNNPDKLRQLQEHHIDIVEVVNTRSYFKTDNKNYLLAKKYKSQHAIELVH
jgi:GTP cyclohydrolase II